VNGVINIITKRAADSQGAYVTATSGNETRAVTTARYGGTTSGDIAYRVYGKFRAESEHVFATGAPAHDGVQFGQTGFRLDSDATQPTSWTLQGDTYVGTEGLYDRGDTRVAGGNLLTRWTKRWSSTSQFQVQAYFDRTARRVQNQYRATRNTVDIDTEEQMQVGARHSVVFGAGFRASRGNDLGDGPGFFFDPQVLTSTIGSLFGQDEISLMPQRLALILGAKVERNDFTGFELQPNVRIRLTPDARQTYWAAVSRAVRMPTRFDTDLRVTNPLNGQLLITGSDAFVSETVLAWEAGYRVRPTSWVSADVATFLNSYDHIRSQELRERTGALFTLANGLDAKTSGVEVAVTTSLTPWWQAHASYSYLWERFSKDAGSTDASNGVNEANDPSHLLSVRTSVDLPGRVEVDVLGRYASRRPQPAVPAYVELTARLGWHPSLRWELSIAGQNLLHDRHLEFAAGTPPELFERAVSVRSAWRF
jgi:iron complex outermembrane receptor protein